MPRSAHTKSTSRGKKGDKRQLNAALEEQLVLDFNRAAAEHGRDALLENLIFKFLEKARPESPSVLQFRLRAKSAAESPDLGDGAVDDLDVLIEQRKALSRVRDLATQIVEITTASLGRKPPKRTSLETSIPDRERSEGAR